jgi:hypothetical protein
MGGNSVDESLSGDWDRRLYWMTEYNRGSLPQAKIKMILFVVSTHQDHPIGPGNLSSRHIQALLIDGGVLQNVEWVIRSVSSM